MSDDGLIHEHLSEAIIGSAMHVLNTLKPGLDEKLYENALVIELRKRGHEVEQQRSFPVHYDGQLIGTLVPDLIVDGATLSRGGVDFRRTISIGWGIGCWGTHGRSVTGLERTMRRL